MTKLATATNVAQSNKDDGDPSFRNQHGGKGGRERGRTEERERERATKEMRERGNKKRLEREIVFKK